MKRGLTCAFCGAGMMVLILDSATALRGASEGVVLCLGTLIPGLFPFFVLSGLLTAALPRGGLAAAGILGGYPVGARSAAQVYHAGQVSRADAQRLAVLFNCPGPAFIFGVAGQLFPPRLAAALWAVYLSSTGILWLILPRSGRCTVPAPAFSLPQAMRGAVTSMASVCGWVVLMRTMLAVLDRWVLWLLPPWGQALTAGMLELTNGMLLLQAVEENLRFILAAGMLGFGGVCVMMQSMGVAQDLTLKLYFPGKLLQGCLCTAGAALVLRYPLSPWIWAALGSLAACCAVKLRKSENSYGNLRTVGV